MTMVIYKSTDASAPTLQGIVGGAYASGWADGSLLQLLRKILVTGYGAGAQAAGAGWSQTFQGTSEGVFRQGAGCQFYLHVLDDGSMTAGAREANMYGSENQTAISTSTAKFPTVAQVTNGIIVRKSETADTVQRQWICFADSKTFYLFVSTGQATPYFTGTMFGDIYSYYSGDAYNCAIIGRETSAIIDGLTNERLDAFNLSGSALVGHYIARGYSQGGTSVNVAKAASFFQNTTAAAVLAASEGLPFPNNADGKLWMSRVYITDPTTVPVAGVRGFLRGFWSSQCAGSQLPLEYTVNGSGGMAGRIFRVLGLRTGNNANGRYLMETSSTWD